VQFVVGGVAMSRLSVGSVIAVAAFFAAHASAAPTTFIGTGGNNTSVAVGSANFAMSAFEAAIGGANNGSGTGTYANGFRSINWDGVPDVYATPNLLPDNYFNSISPRGVKLLTPGTGVAVSASTASGLALHFGDINSTYTSNFVAFSPERLFAPMQSNIVQVYFFKPGTNLPAMVQGFGAVFNDVESSSTKIHYYGFDGASLGTGQVTQPAGGSQASFFGVLFAPTDPPIGHVVITLGDAALAGSTNENALTDLVVMDDITYSEPRADDIFADGFE
jgi:hypothetical protein